MNLADLRAKVISWLGVDYNRMGSSDVVDDIINMSMREICRDNDLMFNYVRSTQAVTAGSDYATVPWNVASDSVEGSPWTVRPFAYSFYKAGETIAERGFLTLVSSEKLDLLFPDPTVTGTPTHLAPGGNAGELVFRPLPDTDGTLIVQAYGTPSDLGGSYPADENEFTRSNWEPIFFLALIKASKFLLEEARIPVWQEEYDKALAALLREHNRMATGARRPASTEPG